MENGVFLIDKPIGVSSREVDNLIGKRLSVKSVGHLGTLDPFASGLLIVGTGDGTRYFPFVDDTKKTYRAVLKLGLSTDTGDKDGKVIERKAVPALNEDAIKEVLASFVGRQEQIPPAYSAKRIDGVRSYELARKGETVSLKPQQIDIYGMRLESFRGDLIEFEAEVSKGTYIRTLGEDIAKRLNTAGHLVSLRREKIGSIDVNKAVKLDDVSWNNVVDPTDILSNASRIFADDELKKRVVNGMPIRLKSNADYILPLNKSGKTMAIYRRHDDCYECVRGFGFSGKKVSIRYIESVNDLSGIDTSGGVALAIGEFDGLHSGHMRLFEKLKASTKKKIILTFDCNFKSFIRNGKSSYLMNNEEKVNAILDFGFVDDILIFKPTEKIISLSPTEFIESFIKRLNVREIIIGEDFTFGCRGSGSPADFMSNGFKTTVVPLVTWGGDKISSSLIKNMVLEGRVDEARCLLGHYFTCEGVVEHGFEEGRKIGFPTANMTLKEGKIYPGKGVYKTYCIIGNEIYHSMTNIGTHPTVNEVDVPLLETNILDGFDSMIYGRNIKIIFERKIRDEQKFESLESLIEMLRHDQSICECGDVDFSIGDYPFI